jgi:acid stress-induced BolA-like protein IbaG/YrbA
MEYSEYISAINTSDIVEPIIEIESRGFGGLLIKVTSKTFEGMSQLDRQDLIWNHLEKVLNRDQIGCIIGILTVFPNEWDITEADIIALNCTIKSEVKHLIIDELNTEFVGLFDEPSSHKQN